MVDIQKLDFQDVIDKLTKKNHEWGIGFYYYDDLLMILHEIDPFPIIPLKNPVMEVAKVLDELGYSMVTVQKNGVKRLSSKQL